MKKILLVLTCIVAMAMMIVGCGGSDKKDAAKGNDKKITVGFSVSTQNNPFFVSLAKGVEAKAKELGVTVKVVDAQNDPAKQAMILLTCCSKTSAFCWLTLLTLMQFLHP